MCGIGSTKLAVEGHGGRKEACSIALTGKPVLSIINFSVMVGVLDLFKTGAVPLSNVCDVVAFVPEQGRISVCPSIIPFKISGPCSFVTAVVHSSVQSSSADPTDAINQQENRNERTELPRARNRER